MIAFTTVNISTDDPQPESEPESLAGSLSEPELTQEPQVMQLRAAAKEYFPASQLMHEAAVVPADPLNLPAAQLPQLLAATPEYLPPPQLESESEISEVESEPELESLELEPEPQSFWPPASIFLACAQREVSTDIRIQ